MALMIKELKAHMLAEAEQDDLICRYVDVRPDGFDVSQARLHEFGVPIWAIIADLRAAGGNLDETAWEYNLPREAVIAAVYFYWQHQAIIDAELTLHAATFA